MKLSGFLRFIFSRSWWVLLLFVSLSLTVGCEEEEEEEQMPAPVAPPADTTPVPVTPTIVDQGDYRFIFVSETLVNGSGATSGVGSGLVSMDSICASEATELGLQGVFKTFIDDGLSRKPSGSDWVLNADVEYRNLNKEVIAVSLEKNTVGYQGAYLFDPESADPNGWDFVNPISSVVSFPWTGMDTDSGGNISNNCLNWTDIDNNGSVINGNYGDASLRVPGLWVIPNFSSGPSSYAYTYDSGQLTNCTSLHSIYCVQTKQPPPPGDWKRIFQSATSTNLNIGTAGFDAVCAADASTKGLSGIYKAMVASEDYFDNISFKSSTERKACVTASCSGAAGIEQSVDWVLAANMNYRQEDGFTHIGTTNANAIFDFGDGSTKALTYGFVDSDAYITGMASSWVIATSANRCFDWTANNGGMFTEVGSGGRVDGASIYNTFASAANCSLQAKVLCVEQ